MVRVLITYHLPLIAYHLSLITYHLSLITYHLSLITYHLYYGGHARYLARLRVAKQTFMHQRVYDPVLGRVVPLTPPPPGATRMAHCGADLDDALAHGLCATGEFHPRYNEI